ncbi:polysaccharide deacetylase family protein [Candidatus Halobonum tyrrellensis]|uniref:Polysaccharide deacetylase n=1 Tax=Candidatus Halobonum tyrrellensis G22 TaxID=1324957 RepID=V4IYQ5_9EURY|nr:polysaccharide deacetylase family protein [Candidatus Halobonum tyrrellensis]ESP88262.1 polysaccharide deacetylase [Candidatus Halobonum tyrrellensis G22]
MTRRSAVRGITGILAGLGVSGRALGAPSWSRLVVSNRNYEANASYEFEVSGDVETLDSPAGDDADGSRAWGGVYGWKDGYRFTGEVVWFSHDGPVDVFLDGEAVDPATLGTPSHRVEIRGTGSKSTYEFSVSGEVVDGGGLSGPDSYSGASASGVVWDGGRDGYTYTGELTAFSNVGPVEVRVDGETVDPSTLGSSGASWRKLVVSNEGFEANASYEFEVSGDVAALNAPAGDNADGSRAWGGVYGWKDGYRFTGEVVSFSHDGPVRLFVDDTETDPARLGGDGGGSGPSLDEIRARGTPLHDSDDWSGWSPLTDTSTVTPDSGVAYRGSTGLRIGVDARRFGARYDPPSPLDLSGKRLSLALKWKAPKEFGKLSVGLVDSEGNRSAFLSRVPKGLRDAEQGWVRCPVAADVMGEDEAALDDVVSVRVSTWAIEDGELWLDDIRVHEQSDRGKVAFTFDDSGASRRRAVELLNDRGIAGTLFTMSHLVGNRGVLSLSDLNDAKAAGWDVASHPQHRDSLAEMSTAEAAAAMDADREWLRDHDFDPDVLAWPYGEFDTGALRAAEERYDLAFSVKGAPSASEISAPMNVGRIDASTNGEHPGHIPTAAKRSIDRAEKYGELAVLMYHDVGTGDGWSIPPDLLAATADYALDADVDIVTATDLVP